MFVRRILPAMCLLMVCRIGPCVGEPAPAGKAPLRASMSVRAALAWASVGRERMVPAASVAEEKLNLSLNPADPAALRRALDLLPGYQWIEVTETDGRTAHVLAPDWEERALWARLADAESMERTVARREEGKRRLGTYFDALSMSPEQLRRLAEDDPDVAAAMKRDLARSTIRFLGGLPGSELNRVFAFGGSFPIADLPPWFQDTVLSEAGHAPELLHTGAISLGYGGEGAEMTITDSATGKAYSLSTVLRPEGLYAEGIRHALRVENGMPEDQAKDLEAKETKDRAAKDAERGSTARKVRLSEYPPRFGSQDLPDKSVDPPAPTGTPYAILRELCERSGLRLTCRYFEKYDHCPANPPDMTQPLASIIDGLADDMNCVWALSEEGIIVTSRTVASDLTKEIPASFLEKVRGMLVANGGRLTLDQYAELSASDLSGDQWQALPRDLSSAGLWLVPFCRDALCFYSSLDDSQRKAANSDTGLSTAALSDEQRRLLGPAWQESAGRQSDRPSDEIRLFRVVRKQGRLALVFDSAGGKMHERPLPIRTGEAPPGWTPLTGADDTLPAGTAETSPSLKAACILGDWTYVRSYVHGTRQRAVLGNGVRKVIIGVGETLEGARLLEITSRTLSFDAGGATVRFPRAYAVHLAPFKPRPADMQNNQPWF